MIRQKGCGAILICFLLAGGCTKSILPPVIGPSGTSDQGASLELSTEQEGEAQQDVQNIVPDPELDAVLLQFQKGIYLLESGKAEEARSFFEALRDRYPEVSVIHNNLGVTYKRLSLPEKAVESYKKAIDLQGGGYAEAHYNLAIVFREQGAFRKAEAVYKTVIALNPEFQDAHYNLAVLYDLYLDNPVGALQHYRKYMEIVDGDHQEMKLWVAALQKRLPPQSVPENQLEVEQ